MTEHQGKDKGVLELVAALGPCDRNLLADAMCQRDTFLASPAERLANY